MKRIMSVWGLGLALVAMTGRGAEAKLVSAEAKAEPTPATVAEVAIMSTSMGDMVFEFWPDVAPKTVENFKTLARKGFFDGTAFHRIIKGFMIQGGDPNTKDPSKEESYGTGDPGYKIEAEFSKRPHVRGVISMARNGDPMERFGQAPRAQYANSAGSQFFICHAAAPNLDGKYTDFGRLIKGEDVLDKIANSPVGPSASGEPSKPTARIEIKSVKIVAASSIK